MTSITSEHVRIPLGAGIEAPAYRATPAAGPIRASVLVLSEIWSVNPNMRSICDRLARNGIAALAPDLYRGGKAPQESVNQLNERVNRGLADPTIREQMLGQGNELGGGTPEQFASFIKTEAERWSKLVKANDIKPE